MRARAIKSLLTGTKGGSPSPEPESKRRNLKSLKRQKRPKRPQKSSMKRKLHCLKVILWSIKEKWKKRKGFIKPGKLCLLHRKTRKKKNRRSKTGSTKSNEKLMKQGP